MFEPCYREASSSNTFSVESPADKHATVARNIFPTTSVYVIDTTRLPRMKRITIESIASHGETYPRCHTHTHSRVQRRTQPPTAHRRCYVINQTTRAHANSSRELFDDSTSINRIFLLPLLQTRVVVHTCIYQGSSNAHLEPLTLHILPFHGHHPPSSFHTEKYQLPHGIRSLRGLKKPVFFFFLFYTHPSPRQTQRRRQLPTQHLLGRPDVV